MKHIKLLFSISMVLFALGARGQKILDGMVQLKTISKINGKPNIVLDSVSLDKFENDTFYYTIHRTFVQKSFEFVYTNITLKETSNRIYLSGSFLDTAYYDILLYDFNLKVGDTLFAQQPLEKDEFRHFILQKIKNDTLLNGDSVRTFEFDNSLTYSEKSCNSKLGLSIGILSFLEHFTRSRNFSLLSQLIYACSNNTLIAIDWTDYQILPLYLGFKGFCVRDDSFYIKRYGQSSVEKLGTQTLGIYPNPALTEINIKGELSPFFTVRIFDALGKNYEILFKEEKQLDISNFPSGLYFIEIMDEDKRYFKKFLKQ